MSFFMSLKRICFGSGREISQERERTSKKHAAYLQFLEKQLDKEQQLGFQRHFVTTGNRIRRAAARVTK